jgi:hypothetical protein
MISKKGVYPGVKPVRSFIQAGPKCTFWRHGGEIISSERKCVSYHRTEFLGRSYRPGISRYEDVVIPFSGGGGRGRSRQKRDFTVLSKIR